MKILKKRIVAFLIDGFILGTIYELFRRAVNVLGITWSYWYLFLFIVFFMRDLIFKNKSIGKKIIGIEIYDKDWKNPSGFLLFKRSCMMLGIGYFLLLKIIFISGNKMEFFEWETQNFGTRVIDKKIYRQLKEESNNSNIEMTKLYDLYLKNCYSRK